MNDDQSVPLTSRDLKGPPQGYFVVVPSRIDEDFVDAKRMFRAVLQAWKLIALAGGGCAALAAVISLQMPSIFRAQALLAPAQQQMGAGGLRSQFGGLAALAGIDLGSAGGNTEEALATLRSSGFARDFIVERNLLPELFADKWDANGKKWKDGRTPSLEIATRRFMADVRTVTEDKKTGLITIAVEWRSPQLAAEWTNGMVEMVNERLRRDAIDRSRLSIEYLKGELQKSDVVNLREAIYRLIETQVNNAMLANVQRDYAFNVIDAAVVPEIRISPRRALLTIAGFVIGLLIGAIVAIMRAGSANVD